MAFSGFSVKCTEPSLQVYSFYLFINVGLLEKTMFMVRTVEFLVFHPSVTSSSPLFTAWLVQVWFCGSRTKCGEHWLEL